MGAVSPPPVATDVVTAATEPVAVVTALRRRRRTVTVRSSTSRMPLATRVSARHVRAMASDGHSISVGAR